MQLARPAGAQLGFDQGIEFGAVEVAMGALQGVCRALQTGGELAVYQATGAPVEQPQGERAINAA
jgi:hypothetical protein